MFPKGTDTNLLIRYEFVLILNASTFQRHAQLTYYTNFISLGSSAQSLMEQKFLKLYSPRFVENPFEGVQSEVLL
jgi:hypothetical protein